MAESKPFRLKEVQVKTNPSDEWKSLSPDAMRETSRVVADCFERAIESQWRKIEGTHTVSMSSGELDLDSLQAIFDSMGRKLAEHILKRVDARIDKGHDVGLVVMDESLEKYLSWLKQQLDERNIHLSFLPNMPDQYACCLIDRQATESPD